VNVQPPGDVTRILADLNGQERAQMADLLPLVYDDLRRLADGLFRQERPDHTLQATALVHEAYLRLMQRLPAQWHSREHFFRAAAVVMRHILVNHARDRRRLKRGGMAGEVPLSESLAVFEERAVDLVALDEALMRLAELDKRQAQVVELRFFAGLSEAEVANVLGVSTRTVEGEWALARAWLLREVRSADE
jgi:RNA polymerase sigma-70 factor (ECF subfamily)